MITPSPVLQALAQFLDILKRSCAEEGRMEAEQLERWVALFYEARAEGQGAVEQSSASAAEKAVAEVEREAQGQESEVVK